jgi:ketosteroid isomerase-like protein
MDLEEVLEQYHLAADEFSRGNAEPVKRIFTHQDDVTLANPWGPAVRGWRQVSVALDFASSQFKDGTVADIETVVEYRTAALATIFEIEHWKSRVSGRKDMASFELRVTNTFRREDGTWKLVHRHADPITTTHPDGPLHSSGNQAV